MNEKLKAAVYGVAVGDALGVPYEFKQRGSFRAETMVPFGTHNQPAGTWSDDTSLTIATCDSIREKGTIDIEDMREKFRAWMAEGKYSVDNRVFDIGGTTARALRRGKGVADKLSNGNGSLMRMIPIVFTDADDDMVAEISGITHAHLISTSHCCTYVKIGRRLLAGMDIREAIADCGGRLGRIYELDEDAIKSSGYVVDTLEAALWALSTTDNYKDAILKSVNLGDDTDTIAAVAGGLAGIIYGFDGIPTAWVDQLRGKKVIDACLF